MPFSSLYDVLPLLVTHSFCIGLNTARLSKYLEVKVRGSLARASTLLALASGCLNGKFFNACSSSLNDFMKFEQ